VHPGHRNCKAHPLVLPFNQTLKKLRITNHLCHFRTFFPLVPPKTFAASPGTCYCSEAIRGDGALPLLQSYISFGRASFFFLGRNVKIEALPNALTFPAKIPMYCSERAEVMDLRSYPFQQVRTRIHGHCFTFPFFSGKHMIHISAGRLFY
jgi:hypothetical protein